MSPWPWCPVPSLPRPPLNQPINQPHSQTAFMNRSPLLPWRRWRRACWSAQAVARACCWQTLRIARGTTGAGSWGRLGGREGVVARSAARPARAAAVPPHLCTAGRAGRPPEAVMPLGFIAAPAPSACLHPIAPPRECFLDILCEESGEFLLEEATQVGGGWGGVAAGQGARRAGPSAALATHCRRPAAAAAWLSPCAGRWGTSMASSSRKQSTSPPPPPPPLMLAGAGAHVGGVQAGVAPHAHRAHAPAAHRRWRRHRRRQAAALTGGSEGATPGGCAGPPCAPALALPILLLY